MLEFFTVEDGKLSMSPTIKVYWEIVVPLTGIFMIYWVFGACCSKNQRAKKRRCGGWGLSQKSASLWDIRSRSPTPSGRFTVIGRSPADYGLEDQDPITTYYDGRENPVDIEKHPMGRVMPNSQLF
jgi:hypothetical protein